MIGIDECVQAIVDYVAETRHDTRYTDEGVAQGIRDLVDDLLLEDQCEGNGE